MAAGRGRCGAGTDEGSQVDDEDAEIQAEPFFVSSIKVSSIKMQIASMLRGSAGPRRIPGKSRRRSDLRKSAFTHAARRHHQCSSVHTGR